MAMMLPTWPRMRMPNRAILPEHRAGSLKDAGLEAEKKPAEGDPPVETLEKKKVGE